MKYIGIVLFCSIFLEAAEAFYIISYRAVSQNHMIQTEKLNAAKAMIINKDLKPTVSFTIEREEKEGVKKSFFTTYQDTIVRELFKRGIFVSDGSKVYGKNEELKTVLTLPPTTVSLSINENFVKMTVYK